LGSKLTTTLPEIRKAHWIQVTQPISMNLSQCSAETTLRISSWHLSALETILLHPWKVLLDLRTFLKNKMIREIFHRTHQLFKQIKLWQGKLKSSTRHCQKTSIPLKKLYLPSHIAMKISNCMIVEENNFSRNK
jgi:hypothetical protein